MFFHERFQPLTSLPFSQDSTYFETPPSPALAPFVRCFWGSLEEFVLSEAQLHTRRLVIPDTCVDIIIRAEEGEVHCRFCSLDQEPYYSDMKQGRCSLFAVRLYFWAVPFLIREAEECMALPAVFCEEYFPDLEDFLTERQFGSLGFFEKKELLEEYMIKCLNRTEPPAALLNSIDFLLQHQGGAAVKALAEYCVLSQRSVERLFQKHLGLSPKRLSDLVRYQTLWRHALTRRDFQIQDEVYELGFYDQAHLLNTFRRYHGMSLGDALAYSRRSFETENRFGSDF